MLNRENVPEKFCNISSAINLFTETPVVNSSGEWRRVENRFWLHTSPAVNSYSATTLENNEKF
jgi:hypothetical protein